MAEIWLRRKQLSTWLGLECQARPQQLAGPDICVHVRRPRTAGRMNMKAVEVTIQNLIGSGMDPRTENNPYLGFVYTSFQERATKVRDWTVCVVRLGCLMQFHLLCSVQFMEMNCCSGCRLVASFMLISTALHAMSPSAPVQQISHGNTARHALEHGDETLAKICGSIASDEGRHEIAYQKVGKGDYGEESGARREGTAVWYFQEAGQPCLHSVNLTPTVPCCCCVFCLRPAFSMFADVVMFCCPLLQIVDALFEHDPNGSMLAFADMMRKQIVMPAHLMDDMSHQKRNGRNLFAVSLGAQAGCGLGVEGCSCMLKLQHLHFQLRGCWL